MEVKGGGGCWGETGEQARGREKQGAPWDVGKVVRTVPGTHAEAPSPKDGGRTLTGAECSESWAEGSRKQANVRT